MASTPAIGQPGFNPTPAAPTAGPAGALPSPLGLPMFGSDALSGLLKEDTISFGNTLPAPAAQAPFFGHTGAQAAASPAAPCFGSKLDLQG